jgi:arsenate reductase
MTPQGPTIFHNPKCSTSRKVLEMLRESGRPFDVVEYLKVGWTRVQLKALLTLMNARPRAILRAKEALAKELNLLDPTVSDDDILDAMVAHPVLVERPIVSGPKGTAVCRPVERAEALI